MRNVMLVFFSMVNFYGHAQQKIYDSILKKYKYRTAGYQALLLSGGANNDFSIGNSLSKRASFSINPYLEYFSVKSTDRKQVYRSGYINPGVWYQKQTLQNGSSPKRNSYGMIGYGSSINSKIFSGLRFIEAGYNIAGRRGWEKNKYADSFLQKSGNRNASIEVTIGVGKGRIENVTDAQMAYYILSDLYNQQLLSKEFSAADMEGLAKTITNINNTRLFDYRRKRRFELQQIDSFLQKTGLLNQYSIHYFTTLTDNWIYAYNPYRVQGTQKYLRLQPRFNYWGSNTEKTTNGLIVSEKRNTYNIIADVIAGIDIKKAINIKHQFSKGLSLTNSYGYLHSKNSNVADFFVAKGFSTGLSGYLEWGYFPNSRTNVFANFKTDFDYGYTNQFLYNITKLYCNVVYFVGYNTRLFVDAGLILNTPVSKNSGYATSLNNHFSIGIEHFFR